MYFETSAPVPYPAWPRNLNPPAIVTFTSTRLSYTPTSPRLGTWPPCNTIRKKFSTLPVVTPPNDGLYVYNQLLNSSEKLI